MDTPTVTDSKDLALECFAVLCHGLEQDRDWWKHEAEMQHEISADGWAQVRRLTAALDSAQTTIRRQNEMIARQTAIVRTNRPAA